MIAVDTYELVRTSIFIIRQRARSRGGGRGGTCVHAYGRMSEVGGAWVVGNLGKVTSTLARFYSRAISLAAVQSRALSLLKTNPRACARRRMRSRILNLFLYKKQINKYIFFMKIYPEIYLLKKKP